MHRFTKPLMTVALLAASALAHADRLDRVEVLGSKVRTDVSSTCSALSDRLTEQLGPALVRHRMSGSYTVLFDLQGEQVSEVRTPRLPAEYRQPLRSALRAGACSDPATAAQPQRFGFVVDLRLDDAAPSGGAPRAMLSLRALN